MKIRTMQKILSANDRVAGELRSGLKEKGILFINLMSAPGSGKTRFVEETVRRTKRRIGVIEGDIQTTLDAERLAALGIRTFQINTGPFGGDCHLEASWVKTAAEAMGIDDLDVLFVENIGNLVCPAEFDVGAHLNVLMISVTEGEDKPLKYPLAFRVSPLCLISKIDLLPHLKFSLARLRANIRKVNPQMELIELSSESGDGFDRWTVFLEKRLRLHRRA